MASSKSSTATDFKTTLTEQGYLAFIQGDNQNEWYPLSDTQYEMLGKTNLLDCLNSNESTFKEQKISSPNPRNPHTMFQYHITSMFPGVRNNGRKLVLENLDTKMKRFIVITNDLFPHKGASPMSGGKRNKKTKNAKTLKKYKN